MEGFQEFPVGWQEMEQQITETYGGPSVGDEASCGEWHKPR